MTVLNLADAIRLGSAVVDRVYAGSVRVWPPVAPGSTFAPVVVASGGLGADGGPQLTLNTTGANAYIVAIGRDSSQGVTAPTSSRGGTFALRSDLSFNSVGVVGGTEYTNRTDVYFLEGVAGGAGHTFGSGYSYSTIAVKALNTGGKPLLVDQIAAALQDLTSPWLSNPIAPTVTNSLAIAICSPINSSSDGTTGMSVDAPFVDMVGEWYGWFWTTQMAHAVRNSAASLSATFNYAGASPGNDATTRLFNVYHE